MKSLEFRGPHSSLFLSVTLNGHVLVTIHDHNRGQFYDSLFTKPDDLDAFIAGLLQLRRGLWPEKMKMVK